MRAQLYISLLALALLITSCSGGGSGDDNGGDLASKTDACSVLGLQPKIVNGTQCRSGASPVVQLDLILRDEEALCSGTLIAPNYVLTAAHCVPRSVLAVNVFTSDGTEETSGQAIFVHPGADEDGGFSTSRNDVAVIKLSTPLSAPTIPIFVSRETRKGDRMSIFGFGKDDTGDFGSFRSGTMKISEVSDDILIAEYEKEEGSNTCFGDSGGPAFITAENSAGITTTGLAGVTSGGQSKTCGEGDLSTFVNLQSDEVLNFIRSVVPNVRTE
jgi:secreted trypsin-like serine protease